jgi:hypothetical protein
MHSPRSRSTTLIDIMAKSSGAVRYNPLVWLLRWRYELALCIGVSLGVIALTWLLGTALGLGIAAAITCVLAVTILLWPAARHWVLAQAWRVITPHRMRVAFSQAMIYSQRGRLPIVLWTTREPFGERVLVLCRAGITVDDFFRARSVMTAVCWAMDVEVFPDTRHHNLVTIDVIRFTAGKSTDPQRTDISADSWPGMAHTWPYDADAWPSDADSNRWPGSAPGRREARLEEEELPHSDEEHSRLSDSGGAGRRRWRRPGGTQPPIGRYLKGQCPETVRVGEPFSFLASIVLTGSHSAVALKRFDVPATGVEILLVAHAPGMQLVDPQRRVVHVPAAGDSEPVMFELRADAPGPRPVSITAWLGGNYLGELIVEVTAERFGARGLSRDVLAEITMERTDGAVSLVVRYDPVQQLYRFEFRDDDNPDEVTSHLAYDPGPQVEHLVTELDDLAKDRSGYSPAETREYLVNMGAGLWRELVPAELREQFWQRQHRIKQLTILSDKDVIPWELLYPKDPGHDAGFLVQQFPVTRAVFGHRPSRRLDLRPARFVLPEHSPRQAQDEIKMLRLLLSEDRRPVISELTPLLDTINKGDFGLLHFACHNNYEPLAGSSIMLDDRQFTPTLLNTAVIDQVLSRSAPVIFINACRSAGAVPRYNYLDSWATKFLKAGASAFIGSLWAVSDDTAPRFAQELYLQLARGASLGEAVMQTRKKALSQADVGDPTWLAYTVYGDPRATTSDPLFSGIPRELP